VPFKRRAVLKTLDRIINVSGRSSHCGTLFLTSGKQSKKIILTVYLSQMSQASVSLLSPPPPMFSGGTKAARGCKLRKKKKHQVPSMSVYEGKCDEIEHHVYNVVPGKNGFDIFAKTTTDIGAYIARTVGNAGEFSLVMWPDDLGFPFIPVLPMPTQGNNLIELEILRMANKRYNDLMEKQEENKRRAYTIV
jgi:hypothetical protein